MHHYKMHVPRLLVIAGDSAARGSAYGFRLDILKKLSTIKGADGKTTLLDCVAKLALDPTKPSAAAMKLIGEQLAPVSRAKLESLDAVSVPLALASLDAIGCLLQVDASVCLLFVCTCR